MFSWIVKFIHKNNLVPKISDTERQALDAGTVWVDKELFSGRPDFHMMMNEAYPELTAEEQAFIDGPVEQVCNMARAWDINESRDLPEEMWAFLKEHNFFGLIISKEYGGHGFGPLAFSNIIGKLQTHSMTLNSVVLIPNSIGPAELLMHYGTKEQKDHYLPRLSRGEHIPCFALTEPNAGSDAGSLTSSGVLFKDEDGKLQMRMNWNKRYITLAPISTLLGLAFRLYDPENLLGKGEDLGITCALVPTDLPGVTRGRYHDPMGSPFPNGPTQGKDVIIPADNIIGGTDWAGRGWKMLMEALAGGRAISLPGGAAAGAKAVARMVGAYASLRQQFGMDIGKFEGIQEPLSRIAGYAYLMEAARVYTCGSVSSGEKPSVISAIAKYNLTELARRSITDGMDVMGGKAICRGPRNPLSDGYSSAPIAITVEGANILTRTLIVFGQGALRCHPYMQKEVEALQANDVPAFRSAFLGHMFHVMLNYFLASWHTLTRGFFASKAPLSGPHAHYVKRLKWASAVYALMADLVIAALGPKLKQKGKMAGRFADALSWMYLGVASLRRFEAEGKRKEDLPLLDYSLQTALFEIQKSLQGILQNFEMFLIGPFVRFFGSLALRINPIGRAPSDRLGEKVAKILLEPSETRDRLTSGLFIPADKDEPMAIMERAFDLAHEAKPIYKKIKLAVREKTLPKKRLSNLIDEALEKKIITEKEADHLRETEIARAEVLAVDDFSPDQYFKRPAKKEIKEEPEMVGAV